MLRTDCRYFEWVAEEQIKTVAYGREKVHIDYRPHCTLYGVCDCIRHQVEEECPYFERADADQPMPETAVVHSRKRSGAGSGRAA